MDPNLESKDLDFWNNSKDLFWHLNDNFSKILTFPRCLVPVGSRAVRFVATHDGSVSGYRMLGNLVSENEEGNCSSIILTGKNQVSKRSVVSN